MDKYYTSHGWVNTSCLPIATLISKQEKRKKKACSVSAKAPTQHAMQSINYLQITILIENLDDEKLQ